MAIVLTGRAKEKTMRMLLGSVIVLVASACLTAQADDKKPAAALALEKALRDRLGGAIDELDLGTVMLGEDFFGAAPSGIRWSDTSEGLLFSWKRWNEADRRTWQFVLGDRVAHPWPEEKPEPPRGTFDRDREWRVFTEGAAVRVQELATGEINELARLATSISGVHFDDDGDSVFMQTSGAVYRIALDRPRLEQILALGEGPRKAQEEGDGEKDEEEKPDKPKDLPDYHKREQLELFRLFWERQQRKAKAKERREALKKARVEVTKYDPPKGFRVSSVTTSPNGKRAAISLSARGGARGRVADMPNYVTTTGYSKMQSTRPKVGDASGERRLEIVNLADGKVVRVSEPVQERGAYPGGPRWSADGSMLVCSARSDDDEDAWVLSVDPDTGETTVLHQRHDPAWVGWSDCRPSWLGSSSEVYFISEETGWMHLWVSDVKTGQTRQLTRGSFEVRNPQATPDGARIYAIATPTSPHVADLVEISTADGAMTVLPADGGGRSFTLSPDGKKIAEVFSAANQPWELRIRWLDGSRKPKVLTDSPSPAFKSYGRWEKPEIVHFQASDGVRVPARIYRPNEPLPGKPAVLFVHGAGYLQNVHRWWSSYYREYGFHHLLRDRGYTVLDVDYRGSAGYGRDWRTAIYGHMGGRDLRDYVDAARWLVEHEKCGEDRLGIYGGSYGGFMALMGLFTSPGTFAAGAALRPVTDWAHYNDGYTSNILDDPLESPEHYRKSSPIWHAEGLRDHLLICHGVLDGNVHAQGVFRLQQRLIELRKENWEVAYYPLEGHGFTDAASWYDEYRRIHALFERVIGGR